MGRAAAAGRSAGVPTTLTMIKERKMIPRVYFYSALLAVFSAGLFTNLPAATANISAAERNAPPRLDDVPVAELEARMARGDFEAQAELGARYGRGDRVPQNIERAIQLLRGAAEKGNAAAQHYLGTAYANGLGVPGSLIEASLWYEKAAEQRYAPSEFQLGVLIAYGRAGIEPSWQAAFPYLWDAADQGFRDAELLVGYAFSKGYGVQRSPRIAAYWLRRTLSRLPDTRAKLALRELIESGEIDWETGDPDVAPARKTEAGASEPTVNP